VTDLAFTYEGYFQSSLSSPLWFLYQIIVTLLSSAAEFEGVNLHHFWNHIIYECFCVSMLKIKTLDFQ
jgi:hypothetical protein